ncbi:HNH endonuclease [Draconibacterium sediminis]|uniref:Uncharacterized protein n=1 Tax=Draconibacterium sediminis TaxID=1544798 RepID=A0A0D8JBJ5_9BACT|nr:HNH endonuclease domain-containing protein [Draconibacterium sediminis]KJF44262.1 hypothetical protein LH29_01730 [Draconibacterium sediminis]
MRRIKIDSTLETKVNSFCTNLFNDRNFKHPKDSLIKLKSSVLGRKKKSYIQHIVDNYDRILKAKPTEQNILISEFENIIPNTQISEDFYKKIVESMRYKDLREKDIIPILKEVGIKACVYCNAMLTVVLDKTYKTGKRRKQVIDQQAKANLELDHFFPKSKYPFLCTSFYNLFPCCSNCNRAKHDKDAKFQLYTEGDNLDVFRFSLEKNSIEKYWLNKNLEHIKIEFNTVLGNDGLLENHTELFCIPQVYETQKDLAEELIHKAFVYNKSYRKDLVRNYESLFPDSTIVKRLIVGNYTNPDEIHKRPMAKFTYDIAKQLKLI